MNIGMTMQKQKYGDKRKLCYRDTDSFIVHVKSEDVNEQFAEEVEQRFDTSNYEVERPLPIGEKNKVIGLMKDELSRK